jgi:hypothetical protein
MAVGLVALAVLGTGDPGRVAAAPAPAVAPLAPTPGDQRNPAVASDGSGFLVAWEDGRDGTWERHLYASRVSAQGVTLDPDGIPIATDSGTQALPSIAFDGANYFVVWMPGSVAPIRGARVTPEGVVLDPGGFPIVSEALEPQVAFDGTNYLVVYETYDYSIRATRVSPGGTVLDPGGFAITSATHSDARVNVSFGDGEYLATWDRFGQVRGARITPGGTVLDPGGFPITPADPHAFMSTRCPSSTGPISW